MTNSTDGDDDEKELVQDRQPLELSELALLDAQALPVSQRSFSGLAVAAPGGQPLQRLDVFPGRSSYGLCSLESMRSLDSLLDYYTAKYFDPSLISMIFDGELRLDVFHFRSEPIRVVDLRSPIGPYWRFPVTADRLAASRTAASSSLHWQLMRRLVDELDISAVEIPAQNYTPGQDLLIRRQLVTSFEFERLCRLSELLPAAQGSSGAVAAQALINLITRPFRRES